MFKILICESFIANQAQYDLSQFDYTVANSIEDIYEKTFDQKYDLYIFHIECFKAVEELKKANDTTPIIFVDEYYDFNHLKKAFLLGDDYIIKPIYMKELVVRIEYHQSKKLGKVSTVLRYKDFFLYLKTQQLYKQKEHIKLSPNELKLVTLFFSNIDKPLIKEFLFDVLESSSDGSLRVYMSKLKKIGLNITYQRSNSSYRLEKE